MEKVLEFVNVKISLNEKVLFPNINFVINKGDRYMLLGKNGAGKSLLMELIFLGYSNILKEKYQGLSVEGEILDAEGRNLLDPAAHRKMSYVTQEEDFHKNWTFWDAGETACNALDIDFDKATKAQFDELLERFELKNKKNEKIQKNVSCGEGKIIHLITRILQLKAANILLLDEPLNHLSFQNSKVLNDVIEEVVQENPELTIIMISHCRAVNFVDKVIRYNYEKQEMEVYVYQAYNCFETEDECFGC